jgi:hypothetical protein
MFKLTKIKAVENPHSETAPSIDAYRESMFSHSKLSPSVDYWIIGNIVRWSTVGNSVLMDRKIRNGVVVDGVFQTSQVTEITPNGFKTMNSEYIIEGVENN